MGSSRCNRVVPTTRFAEGLRFTAVVTVQECATASVETGYSLLLGGSFVLTADYFATHDDAGIPHVRKRPNWYVSNHEKQHPPPTLGANRQSILVCRYIRHSKTCFVHGSDQNV